MKRAPAPTRLLSLSSGARASKLWIWARRTGARLPCCHVTTHGDDQGACCASRSRSLLDGRPPSGVRVRGPAGRPKFDFVRRSVHSKRIRASGRSASAPLPAATLNSKASLGPSDRDAQRYRVGRRAGASRFLWPQAMQRMHRSQVPDARADTFPIPGNVVQNLDALVPSSVVEDPLDTGIAPSRRRGDPVPRLLGAERGCRPGPIDLPVEWPGRERRGGPALVNRMAALCFRMMSSR
jgi:hypothetical protein